MLQTPSFEVTSLSRLSPTLKTKQNIFDMTHRLDQTNEEPFSKFGNQFYSHRVTENEEMEEVDDDEDGAQRVSQRLMGEQRKLTSP